LRKLPTKTLFLIVSLYLTALPLVAQEVGGLNLEDAADLKMLLDEAPEKKDIVQKQKKLTQKIDDLESSVVSDDLDDLDILEADLGGGKKDIDPVQSKAEVIEEGTSPKKKETPAQDTQKKKKKSIQPVQKASVKIVDGSFYGSNDPLLFDVGKEEKKLLELAKNFNARMAVDDWKKITSVNTVDVYEVVRGDWLWKISERLFGSGFYYPKIWSLNPYITNPHEIEPGMTLVFSTGDAESVPEIRLGRFDDAEKSDPKAMAELKVNMKKEGGKKVHGWLVEKEELINQGVYIQYATQNTMADLEAAAQDTRSQEHKYYEPPSTGLIEVEELPREEYDDSGFDANARVEFKYKEGFFLNTFLSTNLVQDLGRVSNLVEDKIFISSGDYVYVDFDESLNVVPGDQFSIYNLEDKVEYVYSDRAGFKYTITAQIRAVELIDKKWKCIVDDSVEAFERGARVTVYTPKIDAIARTFNDRRIEAMIVGGYSPLQNYITVGDVIYLDRGRADGVEMGNIFDVYGFKDRYLNEKITGSPTYKNGELAIISLTDNFSTALVMQAKRDFFVGDIAITKSKASAAADMRRKKRLREGENLEDVKGDMLDELDVELNIDGINDDLLDKADKVEFTEDELAELERQERKRSVIQEHERDLKALERLENEIEEAEKMLNEAKLDEDKLLEQESLEKVENKSGEQDIVNLEEVEENFGKLYLDEELNDKENPYGLTEFDLEEIDELLNAPEEKE
jgi:hypothetical protein